MNPAFDSAAVSQETRDAVPMFFPVSIAKLIILSICTLGLYQLFWFYKNWCLVRAREGVDIWPFWRTFFGIFFCYAMFTKVREQQSRLHDSPSLPAGALAVGWIVVNLLWRLPDPYWLICFASVFFMVPVQSAASRVNAAVAPAHDPNAKFTKLNWVAVVVGGAVFLLDLIGSFLPETGY